MKKIALFYSLSALLLLSSCGEKTDASGGSSKSDKPKQDYSQAPDFNTKPTENADRMVAMQVMNYYKGFSTTTQPPYINMENALVKTYLGGKTATSTHDFIAITQDKISEEGYAKKSVIEVSQAFDDVYKVTAKLLDEKMTLCECRTPKGEGKPGFTSISMRSGEFVESHSFLFDVEKKQWVALKDKSNIPSVELQKQMFADCQAVAKAGLDFIKNNPNDERWAGGKPQ